MVWGIGNAGTPLRYTTSLAEHAAAPSSLQRGQVFWSFHGRGLDLTNYVRIGQNGNGPVSPYVAGMTDLGYARKSNGPLPTTAFDDDSGSVLLIPGGTKHATNKQVVVAGATTTHTLNVNLSGGGIIDSWTINNATFTNVQILNRYDSYMRGIQVAAAWTDAKIGELCQHSPRQGGNYWSQPTLSTSFAGAGSPCIGAEVSSDNGGTLVEIVSVPLDMDPDGGYSMPGLRTHHNGARYHPAIWQDMRTRLRLWLNYKGVENLHRLDAHVYFPWEIRTAYFDAAVYATAFLDAAQFAQVWAYEPIGATSTQISNGVAGGTYFRDSYRTYHQSTSAVFENDIGSIGSSFLPGGSGVVGARGASASDLAFATYAIDSLPPGTTYDMGSIPGGTSFVWSQHRSGSSGRDGDNFVNIAHGNILTGRLHSHARTVRIPQGWVGSTRYLLTDSWTNVIAKVASVRLQGLF